MQTEIHAAEPLVSDPSFDEDEIINSEAIIHQVQIRFWQKRSKEEKQCIPRSIHPYIPFIIRKKCHSSGMNL
jgi:hypothetical protein